MTTEVCNYIAVSLVWGAYGLVLGFAVGSLARLMLDRQ